MTIEYIQPIDSSKDFKLNNRVTVLHYTAPSSVNVADGPDTTFTSGYRANIDVLGGGNLSDLGL